MWHELIHAARDEGGRNLGGDDPREEIETINEMNTLLDWYNDNNEDGETIEPRDPYSHDPETEKLRPKEVPPKKKAQTKKP